MTPDAYYYISVAYTSIAALTSVGLVVKRFKKQFKHPGFIEYILHGLHIPPYLIAAYWYWDGYEYMSSYNSEVTSINGTGVNGTLGVNESNHLDYFTTLS